MKISGTATVAGIGAMTLTWTALTATNGKHTPEQVTSDHKWSEDVIRDPNTTEPATFVITDEINEVVVEAVAVGGATSYNTKAVAAATLIYPEPNALVTIGSCTMAALNKTWLYKGGQWVLSAGGKAKLRMTLHRHLSLDDSAHTALSTQPS